MKKLLAVMFVSGIVLFPAFSHAQTASTTEELQAQYQQTLVQLINLLLEKVAALQAQLADVQNDVHTQTTTTVISTGNAQDNTSTPQGYNVNVSIKSDPGEPVVFKFDNTVNVMEMQLSTSKGWYTGYSNSYVSNNTVVYDPLPANTYSYVISVFKNVEGKNGEYLGAQMPFTGEKTVLRGSFTVKSSVSVNAVYDHNDKDNQPRYTVTISSDADKVAMDLTEAGTYRLVIGTGFNTLDNGKQVMSDVGLIPGYSYSWSVRSIKNGVTKTDTGSFTVPSR